MITLCSRKRRLRTNMAEEPTDWKALRTCNVCGIQAFTVGDLEKFAGDKSDLYGKRTICKACYNKYQREKWSREYYLRYYRTKEQALIEKFVYPIKCYFCGKPIIKPEERRDNSLVLHSLNGNHEDFDPSNKVLVHRVCHTRYHSTGERNPGWKGENISPKNKYAREWKRRKRARNE